MCVPRWMVYTNHSDSFNHLAQRRMCVSLQCFREHVTWFDLWSFATRCLQLALLRTYAAFPSLRCVCACTRFGTFNKHQCFFFPRYCFCLLISSLLFLASYSFPLLSFWFCHTALLHIYEYFLNKQCRSAFKYQDQCCCCIKENCLAQLPAALCRNSPLGEAERKSTL